MKKPNSNQIGFLLGTALLGALTGCIGYVDGPRHGRVYVPAPTLQVEAGIVVQDDYVYYPGYQVYYSNHRHEYIYLEGRSWVTRPAPPRVSVDVLFASPSVRLDFHDAPAIHHSAVVRQYPKHWAPPGGNHGNNQGRNERPTKGKRDRD